jgi:DNA-binding NtrC family response regulator
MGGEPSVAVERAIRHDAGLRNSEFFRGLPEPSQLLLFQDGRTRAFAAPNGFRLPVLGNSAAMQELLETLLHVAPTEATILLRGETGSGKGFLANLIHQCSPSSHRPFVDVVCGALPETLIESELFGHEKGAFTGATEARPGRFELAANGTIFIDEIGDLTLPMQVKLLRVLQDRKFERVGGTRTLTTGARVIVATHRDLRALVEKRKFREDLYYRLNVVSIDVPTLRERRADIPVLVRHFLEEFGHRYHGRIPHLTPETLALLVGHSWPGNVRDLRNCVERLVVLDRRGEICCEDLPREIRRPGPAPANGSAVSPHAEREAVLHALLQARGNRTDAARHFGKSRRHFYRLLKKHGLL